MNSDTILWDRSGQAIFLIINDWLISPAGHMVGFVERDGAVYTTKGRHTAWFSGGVLRDLYGHCLAMSDRVEDPVHPVLPERKAPPKLSWRAYPPPPCVDKIDVAPPAPRYSWSVLNPGEIFC